MNKQVIINIVLATALVIVSIRFAISMSNDKEINLNNTSLSSAVINNIMTRTSVRAYENREIESDKIEIMLNAAMAAPTAGNKQPWTFIVIKDRKTLTTISDNMRTKIGRASCRERVSAPV